MGLSGQEKNVFIVSFGTICTGRNSFSINREETSTEQEKNKYWISKVFLYQVLEDLYFAAPSVPILKTNLFLLICNDNVCLIVKDVFSELWGRKFSDFFSLSYFAAVVVLYKRHSVKKLTWILNYVLDV